MKVNTLDFLMDLHDYFSNTLLTYSTDYFCKEAKEGYAEQWDMTKQKLAIINGLINQNAGESTI